MKKKKKLRSKMVNDDIALSLSLYNKQKKHVENLIQLIATNFEKEKIKKEKHENKENSKGKNKKSSRLFFTEI